MANALERHCMDYPLWQDSGRRNGTLNTYNRMRICMALSKSFPLALMKARSAGVAICPFQRRADTIQHADASASSTPIWGNPGKTPLASMCGVEQTRTMYRGEYKKYKKGARSRREPS